ncbi:MAG: hypothetical protein QXU75_07495 [Candidatus Methanomethylicaceae archaeon]
MVKMTGTLPPLLLPMLIIAKEGKIIGKVRIQKLVYLIQMKAKINLYNFKKHYYGPYSEELDHDLTSNPEIIAVESRVSILNPGQHYYEFRLTPEGERRLQDYLKLLKDDFSSELLPLVDRYCSLPTDRLIEEAYSTIRGVNNYIAPLQNSIENLYSRTKEIFNKNCNKQSLFVLVIADYLKEVLSKANTMPDEVQKAMISNLAKEIIHLCEGVLSEIEPPIDSEKLRAKFIDISELWNTLIEFCERINIVKNPFKKTFEEVLNEDEALRLQQALLSLELD